MKQAVFFVKATDGLDLLTVIEKLLVDKTSENQNLRYVKTEVIDKVFAIVVMEEVAEHPLLNRANQEINKLTDYILEAYPHEIGAGNPQEGESTVDVAIRLLKVPHISGTAFLQWLIDIENLQDNKSRFDEKEMYIIRGMEADFIAGVTPREMVDSMKPDAPPKEEGTLDAYINNAYDWILRMTENGKQHPSYNEFLEAFYPGEIETEYFNVPRVFSDLGREGARRYSLALANNAIPLKTLWRDKVIQLLGKDTTVSNIATFENVLKQMYEKGRSPQEVYDLFNEPKRKSPSSYEEWREQVKNIAVADREFTSLGFLNASLLDLHHAGYTPQQVVDYYKKDDAVSKWNTELEEICSQHKVPPFNTKSGMKKVAELYDKGLTPAEAFAELTHGM